MSVRRLVRRLVRRGPSPPTHPPRLPRLVCAVYRSAPCVVRVAAWEVASCSMAGNTVLEVHKLTFRHERNGEKQVSNVSFKLRSGRTFGVLGGNECGKTTLAMLILGNLVPEAGSVRVFGESVVAHARTPHWLFWSRILLSAWMVVAALLAGLQPRLLMYLMHYKSWALPLLLLILEVTHHAHRILSAGGSGGGTSGDSVEEATETGRAPTSMLARGVAYISSEHDGGQKLPPEATIEDVIARDMPFPFGLTEAEKRRMKREEVLAALKASGFQMMKESGTPVGSPEEYLDEGLMVHGLSGGQRHLIYMLSVLASRPRLLICDDCLCGLDIDRQSSMLTMLQKLQLEFGMAILYLPVDLTSFTVVAHDAAFMKYGRFIEQGAAQDLLQEPQRKDTKIYLQLASENEERSRGKNLRQAYQKGESVFAL